MSLDPATRFLIWNEMIRMGILPMDVPSHDMNRHLKDFEPEERRVCTRKFRKVWRRLARTQGRLYKSELGLEHINPSRKKKNARKTYVYYDVLREILSRKSEHSGKTS